MGATHGLEAWPLCDGGWWRRYDPKKEEYVEAGECCISVEIMTIEDAKLQPVGKGRSAPSPMPKPEGRLKFTLNPYKMLTQFTGRGVGNDICLVCCLMGMAAIVAYKSPELELQIADHMNFPWDPSASPMGITVFFVVVFCLCCPVVYFSCRCRKRCYGCWCGPKGCCTCICRGLYNMFCCCRKPKKLKAEDLLVKGSQEEGENEWGLAKTDKQKGSKNW